MRILSRLDVVQQTSRVTGATSLRYGRTGNGTTWINRLDGQEPGVFFVASPADVPLPEHLNPLAAAAGVVLVDHVDTPRLRSLMVEALVAEAWVQAPLLIGDIVAVPFRWLDTDRLMLEGRHQTRMHAVQDHLRYFERDLRRRALSRSVGVRTPQVTPTTTSSAAVARAREAISSSREAELPQRLPRGARRALDQKVPGVYLSVGEELEQQADLAAAMTAGAARGEAVIDWDGEWPVVVRRYESGRVVYRVEDALQRADSQEKVA